MAFTVTEIGTSTGASATALDLVINAAVGDIIVILSSASNSGTDGAACTTGINDFGTGNTYTQRTQVNRDPGVADAGVTLTIFTCIVEVAFNDTINVTFSPASEYVVGGGYVFSPGGGETASYITVGAGASGSSATPTINTGSITNGDTVVGVIAAETNDTITGDGDTSNGSWTTQYGVTVDEGDGTDAESMQLRSQYKTVSATATQTYNPTIAGAQEYAINYIVIRSGSGANKVVNAAAGSFAITGSAATLTKSGAKSVVAGAGAFLLSGQTATLTAGEKSPLYPNSVAQNDFNYIYGTDPDQFERIEHLGLLNFEIYPSTNLPTHIFRMYFRDIKQAVVTLGSGPFAMTNASAVVRVTHTAHGYRTGNHVTFSGTSAAGGIQINGTYPLTYVSDNTYDIIHSSAATSTTTGGGSSVVATYNQFRIALDEAFGYAGAKAQCLLVGPRLGKLPFLYRNNINYVIIHPGDGTFSSEDAGHYFKLYADRIALRISNDDLEESCFHEGTHAAIQESTGGKGINYLDTAEWDAAVAADNAFITDYAATDNQEDLAESALFAYTIMLHPSRLEPDLAAIQAQIPNRIAFFRNIVFAGHQLACARVSASSVAAKLPARFIESLEDNTALLSHCRDLANLKVEAYYSNPDLVAAGVPDLYKFYCTVCGRVHPRYPVGSEPRPFWNVR